MNCIFCKIINQELPAIIHYEDENLLVIDDISPKAPIHRLIIPKQHIATLNDLDSSNLPIISKMYEVAINMAKSLQLAEKGYRLVSNCNADGGQIVYHIHIHFMAGHPLHSQLG
ncbi:MAG: histidine triad nucleotide-binding protein [Gammaproteobacteria bacterium]|nr:histidine triad nucleotide-binding protein [Gammaproteobacteria bacterium]